MCFGFITYYPVQDIQLPYCTTWKTVEKCKRYLPQFGGIVDGCKWKEFLSSTNEYLSYIVLEIAMHCHQSCSFNCTETVTTLRKHRCLQGDLGDFMIHKLIHKYPHIRYLRDCFRASSSTRFSLQFVTIMFFITIKYMFS